MKYFHIPTLQAYEVPDAISTLLSARVRLGQCLYFAYQEINRRKAKPIISLAQYLRVIAMAYKGLSYRTYQRSYRVYERFIIECGLWIEDIEQVDFILLSRIAECRHISAYTRRDLVNQILTRMEKGDSYRQLSNRLGEVLAAHKERPEKLPDAVVRADRRLVDVKMDLTLSKSKIEEIESPSKMPMDFPKLSLPGVVIPKPE